MATGSWRGTNTLLLGVFQVTLFCPGPRRTTISVSIGYKKNFLYLFKGKIVYNFLEPEAYKKDKTKNFFPPSLLLLLLNPGSEIGVPRSGI